jgi:hypothetical protein
MNFTLFVIVVSEKYIKSGWHDVCTVMLGGRIED